MVIAGIVAASLASAPDGPRLLVDPRVPDDLAVVAADTWTGFLDAFPARRDCIPDVELLGSLDLNDRGEYRPDVPAVVVRYPATEGQLRETLVHEFAHHLEYGCPAQGEVRAPFLGAQHLAADGPWFTGPTWEGTPSEQFAEVAVEIVLGERWLHRRVGLSAEAVDLVRRWGGGGNGP
jgi:hypothetical protein